MRCEQRVGPDVLYTNNKRGRNCRISKTDIHDKTPNGTLQTIARGPMYSNLIFLHIVLLKTVFPKV